MKLKAVIIKFFKMYWSELVQIYAICFYSFYFNIHIGLIYCLILFIAIELVYIKDYDYSYSSKIINKYIVLNKDNYYYIEKQNYLFFIPVYSKYQTPNKDFLLKYKAIEDANIDINKFLCANQKPNQFYFPSKKMIINEKLYSDLSLPSHQKLAIKSLQTLNGLNNMLFFNDLVYDFNFIVNTKSFCRNVCISSSIFDLSLQFYMPTCITEKRNEIRVLYIIHDNILYTETVISKTLNEWVWILKHKIV